MTSGHAGLDLGHIITQYKYEGDEPGPRRVQTSSEKSKRRKFLSIESTRDLIWMAASSHATSIMSTLNATTKRQKQQVPGPTPEISALRLWTCTRRSSRDAYLYIGEGLDSGSPGPGRRTSPSCETQNWQQQLQLEMAKWPGPPPLRTRTVRKDFEVHKGHGNPYDLTDSVNRQEAICKRRSKAYNPDPTPDGTVVLKGLKHPRAVHRVLT